MTDKSLPRAPVKITPAYGFSYISERALREGMGRRQFGQTEMRQVIRWFSETDAEYQQNPSCVYCGCVDPGRWDHLIPIRLDSETILGNMVLACQPCDDSKGKKQFREWMLGSSPKSPQSQGVLDVDDRVRRLSAYMKAFDYRPVRLEDRLDETERTMYNDIRADLQNLQTEVEGLIQRYRKRTLAK